MVQNFNIARNLGSIAKRTHRLLKLFVCSKIKRSLKHDSAIGQHLLENPECAKAYSENCFRIIGRARSTFHLGILESVYIKTRDPLLCRQKEFVFALGLLK